MSLRSVALLSILHCMFSLPASASEFHEFFNSAASDLWSVKGSVLKEQLIAPTCVAERKFSDGSYIHFSKDIDENLYYLWIYKKSWNLKSAPLKAVIGFFREGERISYASLAAVARNGDQLNIPVDQPKAFLERLVLSDEIKVTILGRNASFETKVDAPFRIVSEFGRCVDVWSSEKAKLQAPLK